jgi:TnpA family transposase
MESGLFDGHNKGQNPLEHIFAPIWAVPYKGEARNALARAMFFNRLGELRDRTYENQRHRASGLNLVVAAIVLWNTGFR